MKISIPRKHILTIFIVILVVCVSYIIYHFTYQFFPKHATTYNFFGINLPFRTDLYKANNIIVYPDNVTIYDMMWNYEVENISIAYVNSSDNSKVMVEAFEITYKMELAYQHIAQLNNAYIDVKFNDRVVNSYDNISATPSNPVIALVPPLFSNETVVMEKDNVIYIKGKTMEEFDMATVKFLMVALAINL